MKRYLICILTFAFLLSLLAGCRSSDGEGASQMEQSQPTTGETAPETTELLPDEIEVTVPKENLNAGEGESDIAVSNVGRLRITYNGNISSVKYVTSVDQLPDYPELKGYDEAYFRDHALLVVLETVTSGSVQVGIGGISLEGSTASVQLTHEAQGDAGTTVMTTWLLWAEVEAGLDYSWHVANPAVESQAEKY